MEPTAQNTNNWGRAFIFNVAIFSNHERHKLHHSSNFLFLSFAKDIKFNQISTSFVNGTALYTPKYFAVLHHLRELFDPSIKGKRLPETWAEAKIILVPKQGKDLTLPRSYRPIPLLNCDYKILSTILATRLNKNPRSIHPKCATVLPGSSSGMVSPVVGPVGE